MVVPLPARTKDTASQSLTCSSVAGQEPGSPSLALGKDDAVIAPAWVSDQTDEASSAAKVLPEPLATHHFEHWAAWLKKPWQRSKKHPRLSKISPGDGIAPGGGWLLARFFRLWSGTGLAACSRDFS